MNLMSRNSLLNQADRSPESPDDVHWPRGPWQNFEEGGYATLEWVNGQKNRRLLATIGNTPEVRFEETCYEQENSQAMAA